MVDHDVLLFFNCIVYDANRSTIDITTSSDEDEEEWSSIDVKEEECMEMCDSKMNEHKQKSKYKNNKTQKEKKDRKNKNIMEKYQDPFATSNSM